MSIASNFFSRQTYDVFKDKTNETPATESKEVAKKRKHLYIDLTLLDPNPRNKFRLGEGSEDYNKIYESIEENGLLEPLIVRPSEESGRFVLLSGHRRCFILKKQGKVSQAECIVVYPQNEVEEIKLINDINLKKRVEILPSELAAALKEESDAIERQQGHRSDNRGTIDSIKEVAEDRNISRSSVYEYLHINDLNPELVAMVDAKEFPIKAATKYAYKLTPENQSSLVALVNEGNKIKEDDAKYVLQAQNERTDNGHNANIPLDEIKQLINEGKTPVPKQTVFKIKQSDISNFTTPRMSQKEFRKLVTDVFEFAKHNGYDFKSRE